jgi:hypothetical protein
MEQEKGVSIYLIIIIISTLLAVSLNIAAVIIGGAKIISGSANSVKAFCAADTGIEAALYQSLTSCGDLTGTVGGDSKYYYSVDISYSGADCRELGTVMISDGQYRPDGSTAVTKRRVSISY